MQAAVTGSAARPSQPVLDVEELSVLFDTPRGPVTAVDGISFQVRRGETLGLIGESGCGKSLTALAVLGLTHLVRARAQARRIALLGEDLAGAPASRLRALRGRQVGMIFQEPMSSLNPVLRIGDQIAEAITQHLPVRRKQALERAASLLEQVRIPDPLRALRQYPHEMSGGMRQRVMIAMALSCEPSLLIADEPTTALDVTVQRQVFDLIDELRATRAIGVLLITHNLGVVAEYCDNAVVMYAGRAAESLPVDALFGQAQHPYTCGLLRAIPRADADGSGQRPGRALQEIAGSVPALADMPAGCRFAPRCPSALARCAAVPPLRSVAPGHSVACWNPGSAWSTNDE